MAYLDEPTRDQLLTRLRRIEGQVRGIARMVEGDQYCVNVLTQITAVTAGLEKVGLTLMRSHIKGCVADSLVAGNGEERVDELIGVVERFLKA